MIQLKINHMDHKAVLTVPADYERVTLALWTLSLFSDSHTMMLQRLLLNRQVSNLQQIIRSKFIDICFIPSGFLIIIAQPHTPEFYFIRILKQIPDVCKDILRPAMSQRAFYDHAERFICLRGTVMSVHVVDLKIIIEAAVIDSSVLRIDKDIRIRPQDHLWLIPVKFGRKQFLGDILDPHRKSLIDRQPSTVRIRNFRERPIRRQIKQQTHVFLHLFSVILIFLIVQDKPGWFKNIPVNFPEIDWYGKIKYNNSIYYWRGLSLYVRDHETGTRRRLHSASWLECTHIRFELRDDGNVIFIGYNKNTEVRYELLLDGITGKIIDNVMEPVGYDDFIFAYSEAHQIIGNREILFEPTGDKRYSSRADVTENGVSLLPEGMSASIYTRRWADALWVSIYDENNSEDTDTYLILSADGQDRIVTLPAESYRGGTGDYLFYPSYTDEYETEWGVVCCIDINTGEMWTLDVDTYTDDLYDLRTDGQYLYSTAPWDDGHIFISLECRFILRYTVIVTEHPFFNASQKGKALHGYFN